MKIHIIAIVGQMNTPLAIALKKEGHLVTGSDQDKVYPPFSILIKQSNIPLNQPLNQPDLVIVGAAYKSFSRCKTEYELVIKQNIPHISATKYLANNLVKPESILVAGSYGKTTVAALLAHIFPNVNYFFGGQSVDGTPSLQFSKTNLSIVEADENANGLDTKAKFLYYPVKYLILTSAQWEHKDTYPTAKDNFLAFKKLIQKVPENGVLIYNPDDSEIQKLLPYCRSKVIPYESRQFKTKLIGQHNQQNISAAFTLAKHLGLDESTILTAIESFAGIKRRLEIISNNNNIIIIDDFAQSPLRVLHALKAVNYSYPHRRILVYLEPHAGFLKHPQSLIGFSKINPLIEQIILGKITYSKDKKNRVSAVDWKKQLGDKLIYLPLNHQIVNHFRSNLNSGDILVHFSSGGLDGLRTLKTVYNNTQQ